MLSTIRWVAIAILVAAPAVAFLFGMNVGVDREKARQTEQSLDDIQRRGDNNEAVRELDSDGLFCDILGGLPVSGCP